MWITSPHNSFRALHPTEYAPKALLCGCNSVDIKIISFVLLLSVVKRRPGLQRQKVTAKQKGWVANLVRISSLRWISFLNNTNVPMPQKFRGGTSSFVELRCLQHLTLIECTALWFDYRPHEVDFYAIDCGDQSGSSVKCQLLVFVCTVPQLWVGFLSLLLCWCSRLLYRKFISWKCHPHGPSVPKLL